MTFRLTVAAPFGIDSMVVTTVICDASYMPERGGGTYYSRGRGCSSYSLGVQIGDLVFLGVFLGKSEVFKVPSIWGVIQEQI